MNTELEEKTAVNDKVLSWMYGYVSDWATVWRGRAYFTESGIGRLTSIAGYITGLLHAEKTEFAQELITDFHRNMDYLCLTDQTDDYNGHVVPSRKVLIGDDRTFHSFSFRVLYPIAPETFKKCYDKNLSEIENDTKVPEEDKARRAREKTIVELQIIEKSVSDSYYNVLTEIRYDNGLRREVFYGKGWNGGLIYHGPGQGETFSVCIGNKTLWSVHS